MLNHVAKLAFAGLLLSAPLSSAVQAQQPGWDPTGVQLTRDQLTELLERYEATAASSAYSGDLREQARDEAALIRQRLEEGDLRVGDRIDLIVEGQSDLTQQFSVVAGRSIVLPAIGEVPLEGVLRSELQAYLRDHIARYIRDPIVHARALVRLQILGAVVNQGFYTIPSDELVSDALMLAGGPLAAANLDEITIDRGTTTIWSGDRLRSALQEGRTLDQLSIRAGDAIRVPAASGGFDYVRNGIMILTGISTIFLLGERVF